jgi:hypothetical protein
MSSFQVVLIVLAGIFILSSFVDLGALKKSIIKTDDKVEDKVSDEVAVKPQIVPDPCCGGSIACVVKKWEELKRCCDGCKLKQASAKLDDVFPLLLVKEEKNV